MFLGLSSLFAPISTASAGIIEVFSPTNPAGASTLFADIVQPITGYNAVEQAKYRGTTSNFNQSLDNGNGTSLINNQPTFIQQRITGNITTNLYSFSEHHYYSNNGGPNGFVFQMQQVQGDVTNGPTLVGGNSTPVSGAGIYTEAWGTGFTSAEVPANLSNGGLNHTVTTATLANGNSTPLAADWAYFNAVHFEARASIANTVTQVWNLSYTFPNTFTVLNPQDFVSSFTATPTTGIQTSFQHEWLVTDQDLRYVDFSIQGIVAITGTSGGGEADKFTVSMKDLSYVPQAVPEPTSLALLLLGIPGFLVLQRMKKR